MTVLETYNIIVDGMTQEDLEFRNVKKNNRSYPLGYTYPAIPASTGLNHPL